MPTVQRTQQNSNSIDFVKNVIVPATAGAMGNSIHNMIDNPNLHFERNKPQQVQTINPVSPVSNPVTDRVMKIIGWIKNAPNPLGTEVSYQSQNQRINTQALRAAISSQESGGDYSAISKHTSQSGIHSYGRYQILGSNIPQWTKEALGKTLTVKQFLKDPKAQDAVFMWHINNLSKKYGNINDIASVYFSGGPYEKNRKKADKSGLTVEEYAASLSKRYQDEVNRITQLANSPKPLQSML